MARFNRLLLTGAAGGLGVVLRDGIKHLCDTLRVSDIADCGEAADNEEVVICDIGDMAAMQSLTKDVDAVVHMGGVSRENTWANVLHSNIEGVYHLYESCRQNGVKRIIFASSNHAIGFHPRTDAIDASVMHKPDSLYGLSKAFGEDLATYYHDKFGVETVSLRIGSSFPEPLDRRMLATWLSYRDFTHLVERSLLTPRVGHMIVYGQSDNGEIFWDNRMAVALGFKPQDTAEIYREKVEANSPVPDPHDPAVIYCGGGFAAAGHFEDD